MVYMYSILLVCYNILSSIALIAFLPLWIPLILCRQKYRSRILDRLGFGLRKRLNRYKTAGTPLTIWIHALSVGEVTSALPLVEGIRHAYPDAVLVFSVTTSSGQQVARRIIAPHVTTIIAAPLDFFIAVRSFVNTIAPNLFILVETDLWPNWLQCLSTQGIPLLLVNGRISQKSFTTYQRFSLFFSPMFQTFSLISMQTKSDATKIATLGVKTGNIVTLGNLKFDTAEAVTNRNHNGHLLSRKEYGLDNQAPLWICGSTHQGEEEILFKAYRQVTKSLTTLQLMIAPRDINRADEIAMLGSRNNLHCCKHTSNPQVPGRVIILDTIGELASCYQLADVAFVGGSLVDEGGHNPVEPAAFGVPVLFGPHMEDFEEIAAELISQGGALQINSSEHTVTALKQILTDQQFKQSLASAAKTCVDQNRGVVKNHLQHIRQLLEPSPHNSG